MGDLIVIGGGVIGLSIAWEMAEQGVEVTVLEQGDFGREASWAGAGILPPGNLQRAKSPEALLRALSHSLWPDWAANLTAQTGIDTGYRVCGGLELSVGSPAGNLEDEIATWREEGVHVELLTAAKLHELEPRVADNARSAYRLGELGQVRNPWLLRALLTGCAVRGVRLCAGSPVVAFEHRDGCINAVRTPSDVFRAGRYCLAGGAWSKSLLAQVGLDAPIVPVRGQIVLLSHVPRLFSHVLQQGRRYVVPREDGRILIGATEEWVGFDKRNTACAVSDLIAFGTSLVPDLAAARFERAWSGLRPGSADGLPYLGRVSSVENLFVAAGHFRSGLQMSPATARLLRQAILDQPTEVSLAPFGCERMHSKVRRTGFMP